MRTTSHRLRRSLATLALATIAGTGVAAAATGPADAVGRNIVNPSAVRNHVHLVTFSTIVYDDPGDIYCTQLTASIYDTSGTRIGNEVSYGSVCNGRSATFTNQRISTSQNRTIAAVTLAARKGVNGPVVDSWSYAWEPFGVP